MHDINPEALNVRQVALAAIVAMGLIGAGVLLSGGAHRARPHAPTVRAAPGPDGTKRCRESRCETLEGSPARAHAVQLSSAPRAPGSYRSSSPSA